MGSFAGVFGWTKHRKEEPTRILVLCNMYPPHHFGGYELSCRDCVDRWRDGGHHVTVLTTDYRVAGVADPEGERDRGVRRDLSFYWHDHKIISPSVRGRLRIERRNQRALRQALADTSPDVVSVWHMGAMSLGLLTTVSDENVPMVLVICDDWLLYGPQVDAWMRLFSTWKGIGQLAERLTSVPTRLPPLDRGAFCFISEWVRRRAEQRSLWQTPMSSIVYNGIDTRDFPIRTPSDKPWEGRLLYAGRLEERKGVHVAVDALTHLPSTSTLLIDGRGDNVYRDELRARAASLGLGDRVRFADTLRAQLGERYAEADALLFPVLWDEPLGLVPVEAMASGTPVVATATGGAAEFLVDGANCLVVPTGDAPALARAVDRLAGDPELRSELTRGGTATAEELTIDRYAEVLHAWNISALSSFEPRPPDRPDLPRVLASKGVRPNPR